MEIIEEGRAITFRPSSYDAGVLLSIQERNPHLTNANDLIRQAIRVFDLESNDPNSKSKRLERIEERLLALESKMDIIVALITELQARKS